MIKQEQKTSTARTDRMIDRISRGKKTRSNQEMREQLKLKRMQSLQQYKMQEQDSMEKGGSGSSGGGKVVDNDERKIWLWFI